MPESRSKQKSGRRQQHLVYMFAGVNAPSCVIVLPASTCRSDQGVNNELAGHGDADVHVVASSWIPAKQNWVHPPGCFHTASVYGYSLHPLKLFILHLCELKTVF